MPPSLLTSVPEPVRATPVYLNVYDLTDVNSYLYWLGVGIYHSGIEVHGVEYAFGAHDYPSSGVFEVEPRSCPGFVFRRSIQLGTTTLNSRQVREFMDGIANDYRGNAYHLIAKNCNHFSDDLSVRLTGRSIPGWVNRLANLGAFCSCLLPEGLQVTAVRQTPEYHPYEGDEQTDTDSDEGHQLLTAPNGEAQSAMQDRLREGSLRMAKDSVLIGG